MIARLYGKRVFSFVRNCQTVFQRGCAILHSHQQCMNVSIAPHARKHLVLSVFWIMATLISCKVSCFNLQFSNDIQYGAFFTCLYAISVSLVTYLFTHFAYFFKLGCLFYFFILRVLFNILISDISLTNIFFLSGLSSHSLD